jgi:hypothetical protein
MPQLIAGIEQENRELDLGNPPSSTRKDTD